MNNIFIDTTATREYVLSSEKSIIWTLGSLDSRLVLHILGKNISNADVSNAERFFAQLIEFVRFGLVSAVSSDGTPLDLPKEDVEIPYLGKRSAVSEDFLRKIRPDVLIELGREIRKDNILTDDERKKSSGLSESSETPDS